MREGPGGLLDAKNFLYGIIKPIFSFPASGLPFKTVLEKPHKIKNTLNTRIRRQSTQPIFFIFPVFLVAILLVAKYRPPFDRLAKRLSKGRSDTHLEPARRDGTIGFYPEAGGYEALPVP
jgi:hypothetical protein